jgi:RNA polymerase sigma-70 factor (ECF subfamily)
MERTNEMWLEQLQDGNPHQTEALEDLRKYLKRGVLGYLYTRSDLNYLAKTELDQMSEDLVQEALLKIQDNLDTFRGQSKFTTWAAKVATNHTVSELRRAKWRDLSLDAITEAGTSLQEILMADSTGIGNPDVENERRQVWETISHVINNDLTERQRQTLAAVQFDNIPIAEVARLLDTNINNIYKLVHDARLKLKRRLQALGLDPQYILELFSDDG